MELNNNYDRALYDDIIANSNIVSGTEYRNLVNTVAKVASDMVAKTLGPYGSTTVIDDGTGFTYPTKDGWTCLSKLQFTDPVYNTIFNTLKEISFNSASTVGDGTTTAMVVAHSFLEAFINEIDIESNSFRQADFIDAIGVVNTLLEAKLKANPNICTIDQNGTFEDIEKIALIATNGNAKFANIIKTIYQETKNPYIDVSLDMIPETKYTIEKGYKFPAKVINYPLYINEEGGTISNINSPRKMIVFDHNITYQMHNKLLSAISSVVGALGMEVIICAPYFDTITTSWIDSLVQAMVQKGSRPNIMLVQIPTTMELHRLALHDLGVLTNTQIFDEAKVKAFNYLYHNQTHEPEQHVTDAMFGLEEFAFESPQEVIERCLGQVVSIKFNKSEGYLQDYESTANEQKYQLILKESETDFLTAKEKAMKTVGGVLAKDYLYTQSRYIKLKGITGTIYVGGMSDIQKHFDKDSIDDAVLACRSAYENGYVRGLNLEIISILNNIISSNTSEEFNTLREKYIYFDDICRILHDAFVKATVTVISNKIPNLLLSQTVIRMEKKDYGEFLCCNMDLTVNEIIDLLKNDEKALDYDLRTNTLNTKGNWSVINSTATDIEILRAVVNVLTTIITSTQCISAARRYDSRINKQKMFDARIEDEKSLMIAKTSAVFNTLKDVIAIPFAKN